MIAREAGLCIAFDILSITLARFLSNFALADARSRERSRSRLGGNGFFITALGAAEPLGHGIAHFGSAEQARTRFKDVGRAQAIVQSPFYG